MQSLSYFDHLSEHMAELLHILAEQYDYPQLADEILRSRLVAPLSYFDRRSPQTQGIKQQRIQ